MRQYGEGDDGGAAAVRWHNTFVSVKRRGVAWMAWRGVDGVQLWVIVVFDHIMYVLDVQRVRVCVFYLR